MSIANSRWYIKREFDSRHILNDYDLLFIFKDFHKVLYRKCRLVMQSAVASAKLSYSLTLHFNTNKIEAFKFTEEIMFINLILRNHKTHDLYDISFNNVYSKGVLKYQSADMKKLSRK